jgi:hypothetical protein
MDRALPQLHVTMLVEWNAERRRNTGMGLSRLPAWGRQLAARENPVRREFHLMSLLSGPMRCRKPSGATSRLPAESFTSPRPREARSAPSTSRCPARCFTLSFAPGAQAASFEHFAALPPVDQMPLLRQRREYEPLRLLPIPIFDIYVGYEPRTGLRTTGAAPYDAHPPSPEHAHAPLWRRLHHEAGRPHRLPGAAQIRAGRDRQGRPEGVGGVEQAQRRRNRRDRRHGGQDQARHQIRHRRCAEPDRRVSDRRSRRHRRRRPIPGPPAHHHPPRRRHRRHARRRRAAPGPRST